MFYLNFVLTSITAEPVYTTPSHRISRWRLSVRAMNWSQRRRLPSKAPGPTWTLRPTPSRRTPQTASRPWADQPGAPWSAPAALGSTRLLQTTALMGRHGNGGWRRSGESKESIRWVWIENQWHCDAVSKKICIFPFVICLYSCFFLPFLCCFPLAPSNFMSIIYPMPKKYKRTVMPVG